MASKEIEIISYCDELVSTNESEGTQLRKVIAVLPKNVWVYIATYTIEKGKRISLPYDCRNLNKALSYLLRAIESNEAVISYEMFGSTVRKEAKSGED